MEHAIDTALAAAWGVDRAAGRTGDPAEDSATGPGASRPDPPRTRSHLYSFRIDDAVAQFEQAVALAPKTVAARAMLANAISGGGARPVRGATRQLASLRPEAPEDISFLGSALILATRTPMKAVSCWSGETEASVRDDVPPAPARRGVPRPEHRKLADRAEGHGPRRGGSELLVLATQNCSRSWNAYNAAMRLCPVEECDGVRRRPPGGRRPRVNRGALWHIQRAFYFENTGAWTPKSPSGRRLSS